MTYERAKTVIFCSTVYNFFLFYDADDSELTKMLSSVTLFRVIYLSEL